MRKVLVLSSAMLLTGVRGIAQQEVQRSPADIAAERLQALLQTDPAAANAVVMDSTFQLVCTGFSGTGFILAPSEDGPGTRYTLVTANHVLSNCFKAGNLNIQMKLRYAKKGLIEWEIRDEVVPIASHGAPTWTKHPRADVAALSVRVPKDAIKNPLSANSLADANTLHGLFLGMHVFVLGYPFGGLGTSGFPVLRMAVVSSRAVEQEHPIALSFEVFPGDSGGPVYLVQRDPNSIRYTIVGLVIQSVVEKTTKNATKQPGGNMVVWNNMVGLGYIATSTEIIETMDLLPANENAAKAQLRKKVTAAPVRK